MYLNNHTIKKNGGGVGWELKSAVILNHIHILIYDLGLFYI